jgi:hypothetical protein
LVLAEYSTLEQCRRAMTPNGKVMVVDTVLPETDASAFGALLDLNMLMMPGGRAQTERERRQLFDAAGFEITRMTPTLAPQWAIEGSSKPVSRAAAG